jgi:DNA-binding NtrC family response regulator
VPPLRERKGDIELLARHFLNHFCKQHGKADVALTSECISILEAHRWPGNVRELQNTVERAVILSEPGMALSPVVLGLGEGTGFPVAVQLPVKRGKLLVGTPPLANSTVGAAESGTANVGMPLSEVEKNHILRVLESSGGNRTRASETLGISIRTLRNKLQEYREVSPVGG